MIRWTGQEVARLEAKTGLQRQKKESGHFTYVLLAGNGTVPGEQVEGAVLIAFRTGNEALNEVKSRITLVLVHR